MNATARRIVNENYRAWATFRATHADRRCQVTGCRKVVTRDDYCYGCRAFVCYRRDHWPRSGTSGALSWVGHHNDRADHRVPNRLIGEARP